MKKLILLGMILLTTGCWEKKMIEETKVSLTVKETDRVGGVLKDYGTVVELFGQRECDDVVAEIEEKLNRSYHPNKWRRTYWFPKGSGVDRGTSTDRTGLYQLKYPAAVMGSNYKSAEIVCDGYTWKY